MEAVRFGGRSVAADAWLRLQHEEFFMAADGSREDRSNGVRFAHATPILRVSNFEASVAYYVDALGFTLEWRDGYFGSVRRGDATLMLSQGSQGCAGTWVYLSVSDADALHEEMRGRGARIRHPPTNYPWGSRELQVFDLDGHVLRLGSDARPGEPFGDWLDEAGVRWRPQPGGGWAKVERNALNAGGINGQ
jgi:uncharacterized glyoxalase superfamily protein PhnB